MKKNLFIFMAISFMACSSPVTERIKMAEKGKLAPQISFAKVISGGMTSIKGWEDFKRKAVVMEFWSTECEPCVDNIPHFNDLTEKFKGKPVVFLSITEDSADMVRKFMKTHEIKGIVAVESGSEINKKFRVRGIPYTVLINRKGEVVSFTYPSMVTEKTISDLISGKALSGSEPMPRMSAPTHKNAISFFSINISSGAPSFSSGNAMFEVNGIRLSHIISSVMSNTTHGVEYQDVPKVLLSTKYKLIASIKPIEGANDKLRLRELIIAGINGALPLKISVANQNEKVYLLKKADGVKSNLVKASIQSPRSKSVRVSKKKRSIEAKGFPVVDLAKILEKWLKIPVLDDTGLDGRYDYKFKTGTFDIKSINKTLKEKLGLKLIESRRNVDMTKVRGFKLSAKKNISRGE